MTENTPDTAPQAQSMPITIQAQYIKDFSFENPNAPQSLLPTAEQPQLDVRIDVQTRSGPEDSYEVVLHIKAEAKVAGNTAFVVELAYAGLAVLKGLPKEAIQPVLLIEVPRLLFPFARNIIADATRDGGFAPLMINPIDFADMFRRHFEANAGQVANA